MNISADTIAIMLTMAVAVGCGAWAVRGVISRLEIAVQNLAVEVKFIGRQINSHRHHSDGEVYYEKSIVNDEGDATARE